MICRIFRCAEEDPFPWLASRSLRADGEASRVVAGIIDDVATRGDAALLDSTQRFDSPHVDSLHVSEGELEMAQVTPAQLAAIRHSIERVRRFHEAQLAALTHGWQKEGNTFSWQVPEEHGGHIGQRLRPFGSVGIYVPGGKANYPSSVIMNGIPALAAGVAKVAMCSPAGNNGSLSQPVLVAARECGLTSLFKVGGAAAIAAFALGTESVPRVDKIAGPGNRYVNEAKRQLWGRVGLDFYAGPSEVCVLVDETADAEFAVADWLTQVEHAEDNAGFILCLSESKLAEIMAAAERQLATAPRADTMRRALADFGAAFVACSMEEALEIVNRIAPEHLSLAVEDPESAARHVENAGCILLGEYTAESAGDYMIGPSHTLPTSTAARFAGPLNVMDFMKFQSLCRLERGDLAELAPNIEVFGEMEGLSAHAAGASIRSQQ